MSGRNRVLYGFIFMALAMVVLFSVIVGNWAAFILTFVVGFLLQLYVHHSYID